jgi:uncharacterized protein (TIGR03435 family)
MLIAMRSLPLLIALVYLSPTALAQPPATTPSFEVASVHPSRNTVGPDYNNQITYTPTAFICRNGTLRRLIAEAWHVQMNQVIGPGWINENEYDIEARTPEGTSREETDLMLQSLLGERFQLRQHSETRSMRAYELSIGEGESRIHPVQDGQTTAARPGFHFRGDMHQFADLLAIQFSIPAANDPSVPVKAGGPPILVLDKTGLQGIYEFSVELRPELHTDAFTAWKRALEDQLGLKIESRKGDVPVVVVDQAAKIPTEN